MFYSRRRLTLATPILALLFLTWFQTSEAFGQQKASASPATLRGSKAALALENSTADRFKLERFADVAALKNAVTARKLVPIAETDAYVIDESLGELDRANRSLYMHARPWVKTFLDDVLGEVHRRFGGRYLITSLTRTATYQRSVQKAYPRAAAP